MHVHPSSRMLAAELKLLLCGPKNGEPIYFVPFATHLSTGEVAKLAHHSSTPPVKSGVKRN